MSAVMERQPEVFESVNYFDARTQTSLAERWVFAAIDTVLPERKAELSYLDVGGEEVPSVCLKRYGPNFVPRARAAVLEVSGDPIPMRHLGDLQSVAWQGGLPNEHAKRHNFGMVPVYPGNGIKTLIRYMMNDGNVRKGVNELTVLMGRKWDECHNDTHTGILDIIERAQFGDGISKTLRGLEDQIRHAVVNDSRIDYGKLRDEELKICEDGRNWGMRKLAVDNALLKTGHIGEWQGGWSYAYSPLSELLIDQLELKRQDQPIQEMSDMISRIMAHQQPATLSALDMEMFERKLDERLARAREADQRRIAELEAQLAASTYPCGKCGEAFKTPQGKAAHERQCEGPATE